MTCQGRRPGEQKEAPRHEERFQAVRLLKMNLLTKADPLEKVRSRSSTSMAFPATDVDSLRRDKDGRWRCG